MDDTVHNLSFSINLPKTTVQSEDVILAVNETLTRYYYTFQFREYFSFYNLHKSTIVQNEYPGQMQSEKTILCEINAGLWEKALLSSISNLTRETYPHHIVVQQFVNYLLNAHISTNFGLLEELFFKLLLSHPPTANMFDYYNEILSGKFIILNRKKSEEQGFFSCIVEILTSCLKKPEQKVTSLQEENTHFNKDLQFLEIINNFSSINLNIFSFGQLKKTDIMCFEELPWNDKIKRCVIGLTFIYNILETDFAFWLNSNNLNLHSSAKDNRPLLSHLLWNEARDAGILNNEVHKWLNLSKLVNQLDLDNFALINIINKLINLLAEVIRCSSNTEHLKYPYLGTQSNNLARELSLSLHQSLIEGCQENEPLKRNDLIFHIKPPWLRLLVCCHLLSYITGYQCLPELTGAYDILEHIAHAKFETKEEKLKTEKKSNKTVNYKIVRRLKKYKSVNAKISGKTLLHLACELDNVEDIRALLTFPELDVNAADQDGWTALHIAAYRGNTSSLIELLQFCPKSGDLQRSVNTRARGPESATPLMCAAREGHAEVCRLLLEHTGSVLLEDINESNQTATELSKNIEVLRVLKHYKDNVIWTANSRKDIDFDIKYEEIVIRLCVEMIHAYFCTHRTWDVYRCLKRRERQPLDESSTIHLNDQPKWDYLRYHRDIKSNIYKLRRLVPKVAGVEEFKTSYDNFKKILSFNKSC